MTGKPVLGVVALATVFGAAAPVTAGPLPVAPQSPALSTAAFAGGSAFQDQASLSAYYQSEYGYCDAMKVAHVWGTDLASAKAVIGSKILGGLTHLLDQDIASTASSVQCSWIDLGLTYDNAVALAEFWGVGVEQAKVQAAANASQLGHRGFYKAFGQYFDFGEGYGDRGEIDAQREVYYGSDYGFCDALKVAHVWSIDSWEAKAVIGSKIQAGLTDLADADIASTSGVVACTWSELGLSYADIEHLSTYWGLDIDQTKSKTDLLATRYGHRGFYRAMDGVLRREYH